MKNPLLVFLLALPLYGANGNRLNYLDESEPFYVGATFPKLITPQWVGEEGVEAVVILAVDDMTENAPKYEQFLRPQIERLKQIDGRAPISIMTCRMKPEDSALQGWLKEGLSIEIHTLTHPCPILAKNDFQASADTYHGCVDLMNKVPGNKPVGFRTPCCDSLNTASPRLFAEIMNRTTPGGNFLTLDSSAFNVFTKADAELPLEVATDPDGKDRFRKYIPFPSFALTIDNYPYPYVINKLMWEFPCMVPSDWEAQNLLGKTNPVMLADWKVALDATVLKKGVFTFVYHPHGWSSSAQLVEFIDYAVSKYGKKVKFLNFKEAQERLNKNLLAGQPLRAPDGKDNGVRIADINNDGYVDVVIGNPTAKKTRVWDNQKQRWNETDFPIGLVNEQHQETGVHFGILGKEGTASVLVANGQGSSAWDFRDGKWTPNQKALKGLEIDGHKVLTSETGRDNGVRLRDIDGDGISEVIVANNTQHGVLKWSDQKSEWSQSPAVWPAGVSIVDKEGRDNGVRFVDFNKDGHDDVIWSNEEGYGLWLFVPAKFLGFGEGWSREILRGKRGELPEIPMITRGGEFSNNGAWFAKDTMWVQNENTASMSNLVTRASYTDLLNGFQPTAKSPQESLASIKVAPEFTVELVASEPLLEDPVAFEWAADGKLWVVEMHDYPSGIDGKPAGRVRILEDTNGDGVYDKSTLFLDGVNYPNGLIPWQKGVIITAAPEIFYAEDTDGDGKADLHRTLFTGFVEGNQQHRANGFDLGLDNWLYGANGDSAGSVLSEKTGKKVNIRGRDFRLKPATGEFETASGGTQYGRHRDDWGNWFGVANYTWGWHFYLDEHYLARNPQLAVRGTYQFIARSPEAGRAYPISRVQQRFNDIGMAGYVTSGCSIMPYRDELFGGDFDHSVFVCEPVHNLVHREVLDWDGVTLAGHRATGEERREFLASTDPWFRPVMVKTGPDGALYVADMYRLVIEHPEWIPQDVQQRMNLRSGDNLGRIYRVYPKGKQLRAIPNLAKLSGEELGRAMDSSNGWQRDTVQRLLLERQDRTPAPALARVARESANPKARLQALCALDAMGVLTRDLVVAGLKDQHPGVRAQAVRLSEGFLHNSRSTEPQQALLALVNDPDLRVRYQLAFSLGEWDAPEAARALAQLAIKDSSQEPIITAVLSSSTPYPDDILGEVFARGGEGAQMERLMQQLIRAVVRANKPGAIKKVVQQIAANSAEQIAPWKMQALAALLDAQKSDAVSKSKDLAWDKIFGQARALANNSSASAEDRRMAAQLLGRDNNAEDVATLAGLLKASNPLPLQRTALDRLAQITDPKAAEAALANWPNYGPQMRSLVLAQALKRESWMQALFDKVESGTLPRTELNAAIQQQLLTHNSKPIRDRAAKLLATGVASPERDAVVKDYLAKVRPLTGDADKGRAIFETHCAVCHKAGKLGYGSGPDLGMIYDNSLEQLLTAILDPNRAVEDRYRSYNAQTKQGDEVSGLLLNETGNSVTIMGLTGIEQTILRENLVSLTSNNRSMMPEGFEQFLQPQDLANVVSFLRANAIPPKAFPGNTPALVRADEHGELHLTASVAELFGDSIAFEQQYGNLGTWHAKTDRAVWTIDVPKAQSYDVWLDWACANDTAGNKFTFKIGEAVLTDKVPGTGTWDDYQQRKFGGLKLAPGQHRAVFSPDPSLQQYLMDLREIRLVPAGSPPPQFRPTRKQTSVEDCCGVFITGAAGGR